MCHNVMQRGSFQQGLSYVGYSLIVALCPRPQFQERSVVAALSHKYVNQYDDDWRLKHKLQAHIANNDDNLISFFPTLIDRTVQAVLTYVTIVQVYIDVLNDNVSCAHSRDFIVVTWFVTCSAKTFVNPKRRNSSRNKWVVTCRLSRGSEDGREAVKGCLCWAEFVTVAKFNYRQSFSVVFNKPCMVSRTHT